MRTLVALSILSLVVLSSCSPSSTSTPTTPSVTTIEMQKLTNLPLSGGQVSSVEFLDSQTILAIIDGVVATVPIGGGTPTLMPEKGSGYIRAVVGASKEIYLLSNTELSVMSSISATPVKSTVYTHNAQTLAVNLDVGPDGQAYLRVRSYPSSMKVWTSSDRGLTWTEITLPTNNEYGGGLAFGTGGDMYCSSPLSFYSSTDGGANWTKHAAVFPNYGGELLVRKNGDVLCYIPTGGGLWTSSDKGNSFTNLTPFNANPFFSTIKESDDGILYALLKTSSSPTGDKAGRLMKSQDGKTWSTVIFAEGSALALQGGSMVVGMESPVTGGLAISQDKGVHFVPSGTGPIASFSALAWNSNGELCILADKGVFVQRVSGWNTYGNGINFLSLTSSGDGALYIAGLHESYLSTNSGASWKDLTMPDLVLTSGTGHYEMPVCYGLRQRDALLCITYFRTDLQKQTNGRVTRLGSDGTVSSGSVGGNFVWMAQDANNLLYGVTENFPTSQRSSDGGLTWTEVSTRAPGFVFNNSGKYIGYGLGTNGAANYSWGNVGSTQVDQLNLSGFSFTSNYIEAARFSPTNVLYLLVAGSGVYYSTQAWN